MLVLHLLQRYALTILHLEYALAHIFTGQSTDDLFICESCDAKGAHKLDRQSEKHDETHPLIRCQEPQKEQVVKSVEERMATLETRFADMEEKMMGRMDNIERLLQLLLPANTTDAVDTSPPKLRVSLAP